MKPQKINRQHQDNSNRLRTAHSHSSYDRWGVGGPTLYIRCAIRGGVPTLQPCPPDMPPGERGREGGPLVPTLSTRCATRKGGGGPTPTYTGSAFKCLLFAQVGRLITSSYNAGWLMTPPPPPTFAPPFPWWHILWTKLELRDPTPIPVDRRTLLN